MTPAPESLKRQIRKETEKDWKVYGVRQKGVTVKKVLELSQAQCDALAEITAELKPSQRLMIQQTYSEKGGTHLYTRSPDGEERHVGSAGGITSLGAIN